MLRDGDKILVGISGSSASICLLHAIRQFTRARGLHVTVQAATIGELKGIDPRALMMYLHELGIEYFYEQGKVCHVPSKLSPLTVNNFQ